MILKMGLGRKIIFRQNIHDVLSYYFMFLFQALGMLFWHKHDLDRALQEYTQNICIIILILQLSILHFSLNLNPPCPRASPLIIQNSVPHSIPLTHCLSPPHSIPLPSPSSSPLFNPNYPVPFIPPPSLDPPYPVPLSPPLIQSPLPSASYPPPLNPPYHFPLLPVNS